MLLLAPTAFKSELLQAIDVDTYEIALRQLLQDELRSWTLFCERDCDQEPIRKLAAESEEAIKAFGELFDFLRGKAGSNCPTFIAERK